MAANLTTKLGQLVDVLTPDTTNTRIGVANASPTRTLDVTGTFGASGASTLGGALTYGGITLSNAVTGTGNMVLSASPTLTGTLTAAAANFSGNVDIGKSVPVLSFTGTEGSAKKWSLIENAGVFYIQDTTTSVNLLSMTNTTLTVTGSLSVTSTSTLSGTLTAAAANFSGIVAVSAATSGGQAAMTIKGTTYSLLSIQKGSDASSGGLTLMNAANTQQWFVGLSENTNDYVWYSTAEKMRITTTGSLLVGTTSSWTGCAAEFRAAGNALSAYNTASAGTAFVSRVNNTAAKLATWNYNGSDVGTVTTDGTNSAYNAVGALIFGTNGSTERARINTDGAFGLGTTGGMGFAGYTVLGIGPGSSAGGILQFQGASNADGAHLRLDRTGATINSFMIETRTTIPMTFGINGVEKARIDTSGNLCVGSSSAPSGLTSAVSVNANALLNGKGPTNVANNGTITMACGGSRFAGFLSVACVNAANASIRTSATYSVFTFDNDATSIQQIHTANGSGGGSTFTVAYAATGFLITNTSGGDRNLMASLVGTIQA